MTVRQWFAQAVMAILTPPQSIESDVAASVAFIRMRSYLDGYCAGYERGKSHAP